MKTTIRSMLAGAGVALAVAAFAEPTVGFDHPEKLWPEGKMPNFQTYPTQTVPYVVWLAPKKIDPAKPCVIVMPGGGYDMQRLDANEGLGTATNFLSRGVYVALLKYRTGRCRQKGLPYYWTAWQDAQRCVRLVRSHAAERGYSPENIAVCGFSAGGHLTLLAATMSQTKTYEPVDAIDALPCHVNYAFPVYPAYVAGFVGKGMKRGDEVDVPLSDVFKFDEKTPPMALFHGDCDPHSAMGSIYIYRELRRRNIPAELHVFGGMSHGFGGSQHGPVLRGWSYSGWELHAANKITSRNHDIHRWPGE